MNNANFASAFQAFGLCRIHAQSGITEGGIFGLTLLLSHWFSISPARLPFPPERPGFYRAC